jgi:hypothetical protein
VLPRAATPFGVPFGEILAVRFDEERYAVDLDTAGGKISFLRMGKRTDPFRRLLEERLRALRQRTSEALAYLVPSLPSMALRQLAQRMPDGVPVPRSRIDAVSPAAWGAIARAALATQPLRTAFETLSAMCPPGEVAVGLKETGARQDMESEETGARAGEEGREADAREETEGEEESGGEEGDAWASQEGGAGPEAPEEGSGEEPMAGRVVFYAFPIVHEDRRPSWKCRRLRGGPLERGGRPTSSASPLPSSTRKTPGRTS